MNESEQIKLSVAGKKVEMKLSQQREKKNLSEIDLSVKAARDALLDADLKIRTKKIANNATATPTHSAKMNGNP